MSKALYHLKELNVFCCTSDILFMSCSCAFFLFANAKSCYLQCVFILLSTLGLLVTPRRWDNWIIQGTRNQWKVMPPINGQENDHTANLSNLRRSWWGRPTQIPKQLPLPCGRILDDCMLFFKILFLILF